MKKTALYQKHIDAGAKMVEFGGWLMPVQYSGVLREHEAVRRRAGLFDVSHMGEFLISGEGALGFVNRAVTNDASKLKDGQILYTVMCKEDGGVVDDLLVCRIGANEYIFVVNASNIEKDFLWISSHLKESEPESEKITLENVSNQYALLALQGPKAVEIFSRIVPIPDSLKYYHFMPVTARMAEVTVSRTGYTGEDGLEILLKNEDAQMMWDAILEAGKDDGLIPTGLAARDLCRIEAGYPLYGHELDEGTDPISAGLKWVVKKDKGDFIGRSAIEALKPAKKRIAFTMEGRNIPREGYPIAVNGDEIGAVTSGTFSPVLQKPIGMGYISLQGITGPQTGDKIEINIRGKQAPAVICKTPFIKTGVKK
ncbi:MAG: glycine cleavage system aminomethyltransferase GcvT [Nitrospinota bacterium]